MPDTSNRSATQATQMGHKCNTSNTSETRATRVWDKCDTSATRVKNFGFDSDPSKHIFLRPYIYFMASERLKGDEKFHSKAYLLKMPCFHAKMHLKSAPQKLDFLMTKAISKSCTLDRSCIARSRIVTHSNAASFSIRTILCENTNILFSKNYWKLGNMNARFWKNI